MLYSITYCLLWHNISICICICISSGSRVVYQCSHMVCDFLGRLAFTQGQFLQIYFRLFAALEVCSWFANPFRAVPNLCILLLKDIRAVSSLGLWRTNLLKAFIHVHRVYVNMLFISLWWVPNSGSHGSSKKLLSLSHAVAAPLRTLSTNG